MSLALTAPFGGGPGRPAGVLVAGGNSSAVGRMMAAFAGGHHPRLWICTAAGRLEAVALLDSIQFDLVVCDDAADPASVGLVDAVRRGPYGGSLLLARGPLAAISREPLDAAVHRVFGLEVPAPQPARRAALTAAKPRG